MTRLRILICGVISMLLVSISGCAGNGLRNMFSRNETDGYSTLEELEAFEKGQADQESGLAENDDAKTSGPRFASWIPLVGKTNEDPDALADNASASAEENAAAGQRWWQNPFRRRGAAEMDPFLTAETESEAMIAGRDLPISRNTDERATARPVRTVSDLRQGDSENAENAVLVDRFEQQFKQNTVETAEAVEHAEPLIVAGRKSPSAKEFQMPSTVTSADDKLAELEALLADKKSSASRRARRDAFLAGEETADAAQIADEFEETGNTFQKREMPGSPAPRGANSHAVSNFDSLLGAPLADSAETSASRRKPVHSGSSQTSDVRVAEAESLFGEAVNDTIRRSSNTSGGQFGGKDESGWSEVPADEDGFRWVQSQLGTNDNPDTGRAKQAIHSTVDQFATMFQSRRDENIIPPAVLEDPPESSSPSNDRNAQKARSAGIQMPSDRMIKTVSTSGVIPAVTRPSVMTDDQFFSDNESANALTTEGAARPSSQSSSLEPAVGAIHGTTGPLSGRSWLLLIGGIIVVALLFAPGRRKSAPVDHVTVQG